MPVRGYKIKTEPQSPEQSNIEIKPIQDINPADFILFSDQFLLFRKYYPDDPESEIADKVFALMEVLEHFRTNIINSPFLSTKDQLSKCRSSFNKALSQHRTSTIPRNVSKNQLTPSAYLQSIPSIKKLLESAFANIDIEEMIKLFNSTRTEINIIVQNLSQIHQKYQSRDKEFQQSYNEFQKTKKTFVTQVNQLREYHQSRRCTSLVIKNNYLLGHFKILCKALKQTGMRDKGINYFNDITRYFLEIKAAYLGLNITQRIDSLLEKLNSEKGKQDGLQDFSDDEYDKDDKKNLSSNKKRDIHKGRNRRNTRTTLSNPKQIKKTMKNLNSSKDDNNYYEYEEEEEEDSIEEEYEEEEEEEILEEEEEEEEEEEVKEIIVNQPKRNRRTNTKSEQGTKEETQNNRRSRSTSNSTSSTSQSRSSINSRQSNATNESNRKQRNNRGRRTYTDPETNDNKTISSNTKSSDQQAANRRGRRTYTDPETNDNKTISSNTKSSDQQTANKRGRRTYSSPETNDNKTILSNTKSSDQQTANKRGRRTYTNPETNDNKTISSNTKSSDQQTANKRGRRTYTNPETNDNKTISSNAKSSDQQTANKRGRSRNSTKNDTNPTNPTTSAPNSTSSNSQSNGRNRRSQAVGIAARIMEKNMSHQMRGTNSSTRSKNNQNVDFSSQLQSRRSKRRRNSEISDEDDGNKSKSNLTQNIITRSSTRNRDKEGKEGQNINDSSQSNIGTTTSGQGKAKHETKAQKQERKLVYSQIQELTVPLLEIVGRDSLINNEEEEEEKEKDKEFPNLIFKPLIELYKSEHPTESGLNSAFAKSCKEFRTFLDGINFELFSIKIFYMINQIEVYKIINNINSKDIDQLISFASLLPDKLNKYQQVQYLELLNLDIIDQLKKVTSGENPENPFGPEPLFLLNIFEEIFSVLTPIVCLIKALMPFNSRIKANKLTRNCDYLFIPYNNYLDRQSNINSSLHCQSYSSVPFKSIKSNRDFDSFIFFLCQEIEKNGIEIFSKTLGQDFNIMNIYVPKINELLKNIQNLLSIVCSTANDEILNQFSLNLLKKIYEIGKINDIEKSVCKLKNSPLNLESIVDFDSLLAMLKTLRDIHFLFVALNGRNIINYSNALNLTYARMFVEQICEEDLLNDQYLCAPIDPNKSIRIRNILNSSQIESLQEKLKSSYLIRMKSFDYFPSNYFYTLYNIENIKTPALKSSTPSSSEKSIYPPEMADLIYTARLKSKKSDENSLHPTNEEEINLIKQIFNIDKDMNSFDFKSGNGDACITALSEIYLDLLEMIALKDKIFVIPSSLSNFLALRSQSIDFAERIGSIQNFKEFVLIFHETFQVNITSIINNIINEIEKITIPKEETQEKIETKDLIETKEEAETKNEVEITSEKKDDIEISPESSEKVVAFLILTVLKRGYLSTIAVSQFVKFLTDETNKLHEVFCMNEKLMKAVLDLCKVVMFIDIHDKIIKSMPSINNVSILRNINLGLFCTSISRSLLFLNSTTTIIISNQSHFSISDLSELNKYGKYVLSNINKIDRYQKDELVESIKKLYPILPTSSDIGNELSEEKMNKIEPENRESTFLKISCSNVKMEIDDFTRFQSDSNKRTLKITNPILLQLLNSSSNKNILLFCIYAFDVPKSVYSSSDSPEKRSYVSNLQLKQEKRNERLRKIDEVLQLKEMQYLASTESLFIPIPCSLLNIEQQEFMAKYYSRLQDERDELVIKEKMFQEYLQKKENLLHQAQEQSVKRKELIEKFYAARERLKQVTKKAQQQEEINKRRSEKEQSNLSSFPQKSSDPSSTLKFENDAILASQHLKNKISIQKIQKDLITLEKRTRQSLDSNRNFKKWIDDLNKKYEDRVDLFSPSLKNQTSKSRDSDDFDIKDLSNSKIDDFVKNQLIEMNLASEKTFAEIEKTANEIKKLEEGTADEEAHLFILERANDIMPSNEISPEEKENYIALMNEINMLMKEKEALQNNQS